MLKKVRFERKKLINLIIVSLFVFSLFSFSIFAQEEKTEEVNTGNLMGFIYGKNAKTPVPKAQVFLHQLKRGKIALGSKVYKSNITDKKGDYRLLNVPVGTYKVTIRLKNKPYKIKKIDFLITMMAGKTGYVSFSLRKKTVPLAYIIIGTAVGPALGLSLLKTGEDEASPTVL